jgi:digeranylgeranylglycerophospholipid reductase
MTIKVIGASISGLSAALKLVKNNIDVDVYDKKLCAGSNIVCGEAISIFMQKEFDIDIPEPCIASIINKIKLISKNRECILKTNKCYGFTFYRNLYEMYLAKQIEKYGGNLYFSNPVKTLDPSQITIAADGITGITRKYLGLKINSHNIHLGVQKLGYMEHSSDRIDLYLGSEYAPQGYVWVFPEAKNRVRVGLGIPLTLRKNAGKLLNEFIADKKIETDSPLRAKLIPTAMPEQNLVHGKILLTGDAGLLCDPSTGGGIPNGIFSGRMAAKAIIEGKIENYEKYMQKIKRRNKIRYHIKELFISLNDFELDEIVENLQDFPDFSRISWALAYSLFKMGLKNPKLAMKYKPLRWLLPKIIS